MNEQKKYCHQCEHYHFDRIKGEIPELKREKPGICDLTGKEVLGINCYCGECPPEQEGEEQFAREHALLDLEKSCLQQPLQTSPRELFDLERENSDFG